MQLPPSRHYDESVIGLQPIKRQKQIAQLGPTIVRLSNFCIQGRHCSRANTKKSSEAETIMRCIFLTSFKANTIQAKLQNELLGWIRSWIWMRSWSWSHSSPLITIPFPRLSTMPPSWVRSTLGAS